MASRSPTGYSTTSAPSWRIVPTSTSGLGSAGSLVVGSRTPPVEEVIEHGKNGLLVDFFDTAGLAETVSDALARPEHFAPLRAAARETAIARYDLRTICLPRQIELIERLVASGTGRQIAG